MPLRKPVNKEEGFTLVELLVVVAIIAILAAIAIPQFTKYRLRAYKTELDADSKNAYTAAQAYLTDNTAATVDSLAKLKTGGYQKTVNINFGSADMTLSGGNITLVSNALIAAGKDGNSVIWANGRLDLANQPML